MYKKFTTMILMILLSCSSQMVTAEGIETVLIEGIVTSSSLPEFGVGESLVWEIAIGEKYYNEESCDIYPCAKIEKLSGIGNIINGAAISDGESSVFKFDNLLFSFNNRLPGYNGNGFYHVGENSMRFQIISQ